MAALPPARRLALKRIGIAGMAGGSLLNTACAEPLPQAKAEAEPERPPADTAAGFRVGGEFEPTRAVWMGYDPGHAEVSTAIAQALAPAVELRVLLNLPEQMPEAQALMERAGVPGHRVRYAVEPLALYFMRDSAVFSRGPAGQLGLVDFRWSQYGLAAWCRHRHGRDAAGLQACAAGIDMSRDELGPAIARRAGAGVFRSSLYLEGGGIEFNGVGLCLVSEALIQQRNPGVPRAELEAAFLRLPGIRKVIWLGEGLANDPHLRRTITGPYVAWGTGGHTDEFVRFADARTVLLAWPDDADANSHPVARLTRRRMQRNFDILSRAGDADGQPLKVLKVPTPRSIERRVFLSAAADERQSEGWTADFFPRGERRREGQPVIQVASASYLNFVIANQVVLVPRYEPHGTPRAVDERVRAMLEQALPGREVVFIDAIGLNWVGGGPHCATLNEPAV